MISALSLSFLFAFFLSNCSRKNVSISKVHASSPNFIMNTDPSRPSLSLITPSEIVVSVDGCSSGNQVSPIIVSGSLPLFIGDQNCVVKLVSFVVDSDRYLPSGTNGVDFTTWLEGDTAIFENSNDSNETMDLLVNGQLTQSGVQGSDQIIYTIVETSEGTQNTLSEVQVTFGGALSVMDEDTFPEFSVVDAGMIGLNVSGGADIWITMECDSTLTGAPDYRCVSYLLSPDAPQDEGGINYLLVPDIYSGGSISVAEADTAFSSNPSLIHTPATAGEIAPGAGDGQGNTLTNGGFITDAGSGYITTTGSTPIYPSNTEFVLFIRGMEDNETNPIYLYFYVSLGSAPSNDVSACGGTFGGGLGTVGSPYLVKTRTHLESVGLCTSSSDYFKMTNDIALGGSGNPWVPITLYGQFDGNNKSITDLYINSSGVDDQGLFNIIQSASSVSNLVLSGADLTAERDAGILAGQMDGGTVTNVSVAGTVQLNHTSSADTRGASLIGLVQGGTLTDVSSSASVTFQPNLSSNNSSIGGLIGSMLPANSTINLSSCSNTGNLTVSSSNDSGWLHIGGLIGRIDDSVGNSTLVSNCFVTGNVSVEAIHDTASYSANVAGFLGRVDLSSTTIERSFATGDFSIVTSTTFRAQVGGFLGQIANVNSSFVLEDNYFSGSVNHTRVSGSNTVGVGGFIGNIYNSTSPSLEKNYSSAISVTADSPTEFAGFLGSSISSTISPSSNYFYDGPNVPSDSTSGVTAFTSTAELEVQTNYSGFDFSTPIWKMPVMNPLSPNGFLSPVLNWQCGNNGVNCDSVCSNDGFAGGSGTSGDPWQVATRAHLVSAGLCTSNSDYFIQTADIDLEGSGNPWTAMNMYGQYDGDNYTISNLYIAEDTLGGRKGLFSYIRSGASVSDLNLSAVDISNVSSTAVSVTGSLAGEVQGGSIDSVTVSGTVESSRMVGGLVGYQTGGTISNSSSSVDVTSNPVGPYNGAAGGFIGYAASTANITDSSSSGNVTTASVTPTIPLFLGGFVGFTPNDSGTYLIENSYTSSDITVSGLSGSGYEKYAGGFVGSQNGGTIDESFATGVMNITNPNTSATFVGGFSGTHDGGVLSNSFTMATITVSGSVSSGGGQGTFIGRASGGTITDSYSAVVSMTGSIDSNTDGFIGNYSSATLTDLYFYDNASVISDSGGHATASYTTTGDMETEGNFAFDFSTPIWKMPSANPLSPSSLLSPIPGWLCGNNGVICPATCSAFDFGGGSGTSGDPWQIANRTHLENTEACTSSSDYFIQTANIDLGGSGNPWVPIELYGQYDGDNYTISDLYISSDAYTNSGLFGTIQSGASVSNLNLTSVDVRAGGGGIGSLAGRNLGIVTNVTASGYAGVGAYNISGWTTLGGIVGSGNGSLSDVHSTVDLGWEALSFNNANRAEVGGIQGYLTGVSASDCSYSGDITVNFNHATTYDNVGGLFGTSHYSTVVTRCYVDGSTVTVSVPSIQHKLRVGQLNGSAGGTIQESFSTGTLNVTNSSGGGGFVGGLVGAFFGLSILNSYNMVTLNTTNIGNVGGFVGRHDSGGSTLSITDSYSANVSMNAGNGFAGSTTGVTCTDCYLYDNASVPSQSMTGLTSYTTVGQMQTQGNFNFDFTTPIWKMPTANPLSPGGLLSPVHDWLCGTNGVTCP